MRNIIEEKRCDMTYDTLILYIPTCKL